MLTKKLSVLSLIDEAARLYPDKTALIHENTGFSYRQLSINSNQLAHYLKQRGIFTDIPLCFCMDQSIEKVVVMLGIWKAGGAYVSLDPLYPEARIRHILDDTKSPVLVTTKEFVEKFHFYEGEIILMDEIGEELERMPQDNSYHEIRNSLAYLAYTSGSTGTPKAVMAEHSGLENFVKEFGIFLQAYKSDTALNISSSNFDGIVLDLWVPLSLGITVYLYPDNRMVGDTMLNYILKNKITLLPYLPVSILATLPTNTNMGSLRKICTGGEAPIKSVIDHWKKKVELINIYGPTETTVVVSGFKFDDSHPMSTIGKPLPNVDFYVLDHEMKVLPTGETGELYIGGVQVSRGYYNRPDLTAERFLPYITSDGRVTRLYKTGDLARKLEDETVEFVGRADQQIKIRGFRVEPAEIEENIKESGLVENCVIIVKQEQEDKHLICYYTSKNTFPEDIRKYLFERLPSYMIPTRFLDIQDFPLTANGKVDKAALNSITIPEEKRRNFISAQSPLQKKLANIWSRILRMESVGIHDNFFQLGGNSILAYQFISQVRREIHLPLQVSHLFLHPSIHELENYIEKNELSEEYNQISLPDSNDSIPLSSQQAGLWFLDQLHGSTAYNVGALYPMDSDTSISVLEKAIQHLLKIHPVLRSIITEKEGHYFQHSIPEENWTLQILQNYDSIDTLMDIAFDLQKDFMLRAYVIIQEPQSAALFLNIHHSVTDGWSMPLIIQEINRLYQQILRNETELLSSPVPEYSHYIQWQSKQNHDSSIGFWKNYLEDVHILQIAHDFKKQSSHSDSANRHSFEIDTAVTEALNRVSEDQSATLYMTMLSAFGLLMQYYSGQQDICIGSPSANRPFIFEKTIGYFVNMLPIRMKISGNPTFSDVLQQTRDMIPQVFQHEGVPLETIINHVIKDRFSDQNPLFQNVFVFQNPNEKNENPTPIHNHQVEWMHNKKTKFDLQFEILPVDKKLLVNIDYSDTLFKEETIIQMAKAFQYILRSIVANPHQKIGEIKIHEILETDFPTSMEESPATLIELFEKQVEKTPTKTALLLGGIGISYQELNKKSSLIAEQLITLGVNNKSIIACYQEQSLERIITLLGILKAGAAYLPLDPSHPMDRARIILEDTQPQYLISSETYGYIRNEVQFPVLFIEKMLIQPPAPIRTSYTTTHSPHDLAYVIHTSGTTGTPKGVLIEHQSLGNFITEYGNLLELNENDHTLQFSPYNFDGSIIDLWIPLTKGATVHLYPNNKLLGSHLSDFLKLHSITVIPFIAPSVLGTIPQDAELNTLKTIGTGAEACPPSISQYWRRCVRLLNMYGPTESTVAVNEFIFDNIHPDNTLGLSIRNTKLYVLDQYLRRVPKGVIGELYISGIQLSRGYLNKPELTAEKFIQNPFNADENSIYSRMYKTGDLVKVLSDGMLEYIGRADHQVKIRGYRIELAEIENIICQIQGIKNAIVHVHHTSETVKSLRAFVIGDSAVYHIKNELHQKLPSYMVPHEIYKVDNIPVKSNGKIDIELLSSSTQNQMPDIPEIDGDQPMNRYEAAIKGIWSDVLLCTIPSMEADFFHLGGHSLLLIKLYNKLIQQFPNTITLSELYLNSTIRKLALLIKERESDNDFRSYALGEDPLSYEIKKDIDIPSDQFKFMVSGKGNFAKPQAILLTGVTGFVGINILVELLQANEADIYLLIRAENEDHARERLLATMKKQLIPIEVYDQKRIKLLVGDLAQPFLGLSPEKYDELTQIIDVVHHAGSAVNFIQPYSYMKAANVDALHTLIRFSTTHQLKQLSLLSTVGVFSWEHYFTKPPIVREDTDTRSAFKYLSRDMGYIQSKWVMEQVAQEAIKQGVPITIFRLGYVFCHSMTGATAQYQWWGLLVKTCIQLKCYPILLDQKEELVMVDFIGKAVAHISQNPDSIGGIFHLSPEPKDNMTVMEFFELLHREFNFDLKPVPYLEWRALWEDDENSPLYPLLSLFKFEVYDGKSIIEIHQNTPDFDISNTNIFLTGSGIENKTVQRDNVEAFCKYLGVL